MNKSNLAVGTVNLTGTGVHSSFGQTKENWSCRPPPLQLSSCTTAVIIMHHCSYHHAPLQLSSCTTAVIIMHHCSYHHAPLQLSSCTTAVVASCLTTSPFIHLSHVAWRFLCNFVKPPSSRSTMFLQSHGWWLFTQMWCSLDMTRSFSLIRQVLLDY